ncbi:hypothetical protein LCGC14_0592370 [marine sediment metagenome]|uniref:Uncharacterized protein n=1 Tax=marine sediment metagenome TaxID=412755 RepID=A0A0F9RI34_9ZZZZ
MSEDTPEYLKEAADEVVAEVNRRVALVATDIFSAVDLTPEWIDIPQWEGGLFVRPMTGLERDTYEQSLVRGKGSNREFNIANARAKLVVLVAVDEDGKAIFTKGDVKRLGAKSSAALNLIFELATKQSGMSEADIEELTEDFDEDPS